MAQAKSLRHSLPILRRVLARVWPRMRKQKRLVYGPLLLIIVETIMRLGEPWPLSFVVDYVLSPSEGATPPFDVSLLTSTTVVALAAGGVVFFAAARGLARYASAVGFALLGNRLMGEVRHELYQHVQRLSVAYHARSRTGDLVLRVIGDVGMMRDVTVTALLPMVANTFILAGVLSVMFWLHWQLALCAFVTMPLFFITTTTLGKRITQVARRQRKVEGHMANTAAEALSAIQTVQAYGLGDSFSDIFGGAAERDLKEGVKGKRLSARLERTADVLSALAQALVIFFGAHLVMRGELTVGALLVFVSYLRSSFRPVRNFAKYSARIARASAAAERVLELLELEPDVRDRDDAVPAPPLRGDLRFEGVHYAYEGEHRVLHGLDFEVRRGSRVAVVGPSGSGKSTLINLCLRLADPAEGCVKIDGHDLREFELESLRAQISVALQDPILFASTIRENIEMGAEGATDEDVEKAARLVNAHDFILEQPEGYDTVVGERGVTLSRGQRQRIALARAAVRSAPILLLDEPFTGLDEESRALVREATERLAQDRTTLLVTHDVNEARSCERILVIDGGRLVEEGSHDELMARRGRYAALFASQRQEVDVAQPG